MADMNSSYDAVEESIARIKIETERDQDIIRERFQRLLDILEEELEENNPE